MAVYSKLLLSAGGGIISTQQQAEQAENTASVLIGLGGTGVDCLRTIKTQVRSRLKPDDPDAVIAAYSHIRFLGIDTAEKAKGNAEADMKADALVALDDTEFFSIANSGVKKIFSNPLALRTRRELDWLRWEDIDAPDLGKAGAGGIRQIGRFMMMDKSGLFLDRIEQEINAAKSGLTEPTVNIHIFSGLSGGTGAGCFLDVCYMVRSIADKVGGVTIFGYFFLPDVNLSKIPFTDTKTRAFIPKNGYASMQELDYCMQLQFNGGSFTQEYQGHQKIDWKISPVDMAHLVCATNAAGDVIPNAYDYAMNVTAEYVMDFLTKSSEEFGLSEQLSNFRRKVQTADGEKVIGSYLGYCVIGASCASIPLREINTYLASELFDRFSVIAQSVPGKADVEELAVRSLGRDAQSVTGIYDSLYREVRNGADGSYGQFTDDWKFVRDYGNSELVRHYTDQTASQRNRVETNARSMIAPGNQNALVGRVSSQLNEVLVDINRGPIYAYRMISAAESHNLLNIIDGLIAENTSRWDQEAAQIDLRSSDYENAKADFENRRKRSLFDNDEKRFNDYEYYLMLFEQHELSMSVYEKLNMVLREFRKQIVEITAAYYLKLGRVMNTLIQTFKENRDALASEKMMQKSGSFAIPMMTIAELKKSLDAEIEKVNVPGMLDSFMGMLLNNPDEWLTEDENKISKLVTDFFVRTAFDGFANRTITSFLKDKYGLDNDELLADRIYQEWMKLLTSKARPLFYFNGSIWNESQTSKLAFLSIPSTSAPIKAAAEKMYRADNVWKTKESALTDRIYVMCSACALPLSAYNNCEEYERICFSTTEAGRHYYEGRPIPGMIFDDWTKLPSLTPQSVLRLDMAPDILKKAVEKTRELFDRAEAAGIFDENNKICRWSKEAAENIRVKTAYCAELSKKMSRPEETGEASAAIAELDAALTAPMEQTEYFIKNDGYAEKEEGKLSVRKDHFAYAPVCQIYAGQILEEVDVLRTEAAQAKDALLKRIEKINVGSRDIGDYCDAVFTGVILAEGRQVVYRRTDYGIETEYILSKKNSEFAYNAIPVYQGFLSYQGLASGVKDEIRKAVEERYNADDPEIKITGERLKNELSDERVGAWAQLAGEYAERAEIIDFLGKLKQRFHLFCLESL